MASQADVRTNLKQPGQIQSKQLVEVRLALGILVGTAGFYLTHFLIMYALFGGFNTELLYRPFAYLTIGLLFIWHFVCHQYIPLKSALVAAFLVFFGLFLLTFALNRAIDEIFLLLGHFILNAFVAILLFVIGPFPLFVSFALIGFAWLYLYRLGFKHVGSFLSLRTLRLVTGAVGVSVIFFLFGSDNSWIAPKIDAFVAHNGRTYYLITEERQADSAFEVAHVLFECDSFSLNCWDVADKREISAGPRIENDAYDSGDHHWDEVLTLTLNEQTGVIDAYRNGEQIITHRPGRQIRLGRSLLGMRDHMYLRWHFPPECLSLACQLRQREIQ